MAFNGIVEELVSVGMKLNPIDVQYWLA